MGFKVECVVFNNNEIDVIVIGETAFYENIMVLIEEFWRSLGNEIVYHKEWLIYDAKENIRYVVIDIGANNVYFRYRIVGYNDDRERNTYIC